MTTIRDGNTVIDVTAIFGHPTYWPRRLYANPWQFGLEHIDDADAASLLRGHLMEMSRRENLAFTSSPSASFVIDAVGANTWEGPTPLAAYVAWATQRAKEQA
jgi:hypothetical protein